jgi:hypothetical protein
VLAEVDGWNRVVEEFKEAHIGEMELDANRFIVLLIDFDGKPDRRERVKAKIPAHLSDRVFVLGVLTEPEDLRAGRLEEVGAALARDCRDGTSHMWDHALLKHNESEVARLKRVRPFLF